MAHCHAYLGQKQAALTALDRAVELDPEYEVALVNREISKRLNEGESLTGTPRPVQYYRDYPAKNKSYIQELAAAQGILSEDG